MPAYNAGTYIFQAIESVRLQTYGEWELIVVDDGSTDNTSKIVQEIINKDKRIFYIYQHNQQLSAARNTGIKNSKGSWIAFLDADDLWTPDKLQKQMEVIAKSDSIDVIYTGGYTFYEGDLNNCNPYPTKPGKFCGKEIYKIIYETNYIPVISVIVKKHLIDQVGLLDESLKACEDWDYWLRMARAGANFLGMSEKLFYYRKHNNNMSSNMLLMDLTRAIVCIKNFEKDRYNAVEIRKIFKPFVIPLLVVLMNNNKKDEAFALMESLFKKIPIFSFKICYLLYKALNRYSFYPIRFVNKIDSIIKGK